MEKRNLRSSGLRKDITIGVMFSLLALIVSAAGSADKPSSADPKNDYAVTVQPLLQRYCLQCHSTKARKGDLDLERFASLDQVRKDLKPWPALIEMLESGEMPPKNKPQPTAEERKRLIAWTRSFLDAEARARAGDPGPAALRRLSNAEYNCTIRDLTGVDLQPAREFPVDGAAGEGFTNAAEALAMSPTLVNKYLNSAKDIADRAVLLPDGFRFSPVKTRRDWTNECLGRLRAFYAEYTSDGRLPLQPYLLATVRHRENLTNGKITLEAVAKKENLNPKYLQVLWRTLTDATPSFPLDQIRSRWRQASEKEVPSLMAEIAAWQGLLWKFVRIGSYANKQTVRQVANDSALADRQTLRLNLKPQPGQNDVVFYLAAREFPKVGSAGHIVWHRPRFEKAGKPALLLRDYPQFGPAYESNATKENHYGLEKESFGRHPLNKVAEEASLVVSLNTVIEVRLPAALLREREFVVDGKLDADTADRTVQFQVLTAPPVNDAPWDGKTPFTASPKSGAAKPLLEGFADFRRCFPQFICYPHIIPVDEVVCLKLYHREDEPLIRLFLDDEQARRLNRLWEEQRFISQWPVTEHKNLPLFIGFVTQDQPKELVTYFEGLREPFRKRAEEFEKEVEAAGPKQLGMLVEFAAWAYRRPLREQEKTELLSLYQTLRKKNVAHEDAFRGVLARVLVSPSFLFHLEQPPQGKEARPVNDWELAARLSYFLWSSMPDEPLGKLAAAGRLRDAKVLAEQTQRMLKDPRTRALAIEFGTQWLHVRGFDELKEKNEQLFPAFDDKLRKAIYEESILFFLDFFQSDRALAQLLDADYTFLNETLAKHYGIPNVVGPQWRKVDGVKKYGRGGILGLASVQAKEAGASRTSPVLRGNWVVETLLGEKLPRPPPNVPRLPEEEKGNDGLTMRQLVEKHTRIPECAVCHVRIDPFGFALERYDPIGRLREKDLGGLALDSKAKLKDGTEFEGIDGLRDYLLTKKKDIIVRLFCRRLLGYALGRAVQLSDQTLLDEMVAELNKNEGCVSAAVLALVRSPQFRMIRGSDQRAE
jgi:mono/diheme cytochrome c family protein